MFTGIIEELGEVLDIKQKDSYLLNIKIKAEKILEDIKKGDSIAVNGVCLTVTGFGKDFFCADLMNETKKVTCFKKIKNGENVNLERALKLSDRLGGHYVTGHIDCVCKIKNIKKVPGEYNFEIEIVKEYSKYIVKKGSIAVDGVSLTVMDVGYNNFIVSLIPETIGNTNFKNKKAGDLVNMETDIFGKYVLMQNEKKNKTSILREFLEG